MTERNGAEPITDEHVEFAHALVGLAREHGANLMQVDFSLTAGGRLFKEQYDPTRVSFSWHEGRHGDLSGFRLRAEASIHVDERTANKGSSDGL